MQKLCRGAEWAQRLSQKQRQQIGCQYNRQTQRYEVPSETTIRMARLFSSSALPWT
jgi:hypothetical protein